ncbi:hypothetical protein MMC17_001783 [Xylographa soralifera]|nr:hypothetical protein [Xylographa soralifera]
MAEPDTSICKLRDIKGRYQAVIDDLERILTTLNPVSEDPTLTTLLEDFLVSLELWGDDIDIENGTFVSAERNDPLAENIRVIFEYLDEQLVYIKALEAQSCSGSDMARARFSDLSIESLEENFIQIALSLNNLVPAVHAAQSLESRKGLFADIAKTMAIEHWLATLN